MPDIDFTKIFEDVKKQILEQKQNKTKVSSSISVEDMNVFERIRNRR